jgi:hypothetical protein
MRPPALISISRSLAHSLLDHRCPPGKGFRYDASWPASPGYPAELKRSGYWSLGASCSGAGGTALGFLAGARVCACGGLRRAVDLGVSPDVVVSGGELGSVFMMLTAGIEDDEGRNRLSGSLAPATGAPVGASATAGGALPATGRSTDGQRAIWRLMIAS